MPWGVATAALSIGGSIYAANSQKNAAQDAANSQSQSAQMGIDEQRRQFDFVQKLLEPYTKAGTGALQGQQNLIGLGGIDAQRSAIDQLQSSPQFGALVQQGENGILQNASATGGLRGGNTQAALSQFRPQMLNQLIEQQFQRLGGLSSIGQNAAAGMGNAGMQTGSTIAGLFGQQGAAQAGSAIATGNANAGMLNGIGQGIGQFAGAFGGVGGSAGGGGSYSDILNNTPMF